MKILLIRHGQKHSEAGDPDLTPFGELQAEATGLYLQTLSIDKLIASPLTRTRQTAEIIASVTGIPVEIDKRLVERANWDSDIVPFDDFMTEWVKASRDRTYQPAYGDTSRSAGDRLAAVIMDLEKSAIAEKVVIVSHGGTISDYLRNIATDEYLISTFYKEQINLMETEIPECSITTVEVKSGVAAVLELCSTTHLNEI